LLTWRVCQKPETFQAGRARLLKGAGGERRAAAPGLAGFLSGGIWHPMMKRLVLGGEYSAGIDLGLHNKREGKHVKKVKGGPLLADNFITGLENFLDQMVPRPTDSTTNPQNTPCIYLKRGHHERTLLAGDQRATHGGRALRRWKASAEAVSNTSPD